MEIEILYFDGCPNSEPVQELVRGVLEAKGLEVKLTMQQIEGEEEAVRRRFHGSPSIRINGVDLEPEREKEEAFFGCRLYRESGKLEGYPSREKIAKAVEKALVGKPGTSMTEERLTAQSFEELIRRLKTAESEDERAEVCAAVETLATEFEAQKGSYSGRVLENVQRLKRHVVAAAGCDDEMGREKGQSIIWALEALGALERELG